MIVGIIGVSKCSEELYSDAYNIGQIVAENNHKLICGGLYGVMEAVCKGAKSKNGITIGILPADSIYDANQYVDIPIATNMGHARNIIIVTTAELIIAIGRGYGTLSELAIGLKLGKPVYSWKSFNEIEGIRPLNKIEELKEILSKNFWHSIIFLIAQFNS